MFFILRDFATNIEEASSFLNIVLKEYDKNTNNPIFIYSFKEEYTHFTNLRYYVDQYLICKNLKEYMEVYDYFTSYYNIRINIIVYSLYLMGWFYILIYNFFSFDMKKKPFKLIKNTIQTFLT